MSKWNPRKPDFSITKMLQDMTSQERHYFECGYVHALSRVWIKYKNECKWNDNLVKTTRTQAEEIERLRSQEPVAWEKRLLDYRAYIANKYPGPVGQGRAQGILDAISVFKKLYAAPPGREACVRTVMEELNKSGTIYQQAKWRLAHRIVTALRLAPPDGEPSQEPVAWDYDALADILYQKLSDLPDAEGHAGSFLPVAVCCDFIGRERFKRTLARFLKELVAAPPDGGDDPNG